MDNLVMANALLNPKERRVLEEFDGFVDLMRDGIAYVVLSTKGEKFFAEYPSAKLLKLGIKEYQQFKCRTVMTNLKVDIEFECIPSEKI